MQPANPFNWPDEWNEEGTLFAAAVDWPTLHLDAAPVEPAATEPETRLPDGMLSNRLGYWAEQAVDFRVAELGGVSDKASADDQPYDRIIRLGDGPGKTAQIKYAGLVAGKARFSLGPRVGTHSATTERRRRLPARQRADVFILVTNVRGKPRFYVIPAKRLVNCVSLTVTPGIYRTRASRIEPERYVNAWHYCADGVRATDLVSLFA